MGPWPIRRKLQASAPGDQQRVKVKVLNSKGIANRAGPESCVAQPWLLVLVPKNRHKPPSLLSPTAFSPLSEFQNEKSLTLDERAALWELAQLDCAKAAVCRGLLNRWFETAEAFMRGRLVWGRAFGRPGAECGLSSTCYEQGSGVGPPPCRRLGDSAGNQFRPAFGPWQRAAATTNNGAPLEFVDAGCRMLIARRRKS